MSQVPHYDPNARLAGILRDLDRCPHGRHSGDTCAGWDGRPESGCPSGWSEGNPHLPAPGQVVGYDLGGRPYVVPPAHRGGDPEGWRR
jgi:hypothetical protein